MSTPNPAPTSPRPEAVFKRVQHVQRLVQAAAMISGTGFVVGTFVEEAWTRNDPGTLLAASPMVAMMVVIAYFSGRVRSVFVASDGIFVRVAPWSPSPGDRRGFVPWSRVEEARYQRSFFPLLQWEGTATRQCYLRLEGRRRPIVFIGSRELVERVLDGRRAARGGSEVA